MGYDGIQKTLAQAPPNAPDASDAEAAKVAQESAAVKQLANSVNDKPAETPRPANTDSVATAWQPPRPGSFASHLTNALANIRKGNFETKTDALFAATAEGLARHADSLQKPAEGTKQPDASWQSALAGGEAVTPAAPAPQPGIGGRAGAALGGLTKIFADVERHEQTGERRAREMKDRQLMATSNAQMLHEQALTHKLGEETIQQSVKDSTAAMENIITAPPGGASGTIDAKDKTSDDLRVMIDKGEIDPSKQTVFLTGRALVGKNPDGTPKYRSTYSVVTPAGDVHVSPENAKLLNGELGRSYSTDPEKPQVLPAIQLNHEIQQALNARVTRRAFEVGQAKDDETIRKAQTSKDAESIFKNPLVTNAINGHMSSPDDPFAVVKAYNAIINDPKLLNDPSMPKNFSDAFIQAAGGTSAWDKKVEEYAKAQQKNADTVDTMLNKVESDPKEIEGHTPAFTAAMKSIIADPNAPEAKRARATKALQTVQDVRQLELELEGAKEITKDDAREAARKRAAAINNPNGLTGEAFIKTLPPARANTLRAFSEGRLVLNPAALERTDKGQAYLDDVYAAYPDLDASKAPAYAKMRQNFTTGKEAVGIKAANTALHHMNEMYDQLATATAGYTGGVEGFLGLNKSGRQAAAITQPLAGELGKLYSGGVVTEGEMHEWEKKLNPFAVGMTVNKLRDNLSEFAKLLGGALEAFQDQWDDGIPSKMMPSPEKGIASREAADFYKKVTGQDLRVHDIQQSLARPAGVGGDWKLMQAPGGKPHWISPDKFAAAQKAGAKEVQ